MKKNVFWLSYHPWKLSKMSKCGTSQYGLVGVVVFSHLTISEVFSELRNSRVCPRRCSFQADSRVVPSGGPAAGLGVSRSRCWSGLGRSALRRGDSRS